MSLLMLKQRNCAIATFNQFRRHCANNQPQFTYKKCYEILNIKEDSDQEQIRKAYINLVKRYHPDSGTAESNAEKFHQVDKAFKILMNKKSMERWNVEEQTTYEEKDRHTAPQHRQYLSFEGIGFGTPFQRQKQYAKARAMRAAENVLEHRISKASAEDGALWTKNLAQKHKIKTKYGFDRLVEDLIQESMSKGQFNNLAGAGKPLKGIERRNPYVDFVTHKLNEVLIDNGFTPEWIQLHKEIREQIEQLKNVLYAERSYLGPLPLNEKDSAEWSDILLRYDDSAGKINKNIDKFNLVVPILSKQMTHFDLRKEAERVLIQGECGKVVQNQVEIEKSVKTGNVFDIFDQLFRSK